MSALDEMKNKLISFGGRVRPRKTTGEPTVSTDRVKKSKLGRMKRAKGSRFELIVAKLFSKWSGDTVRRTPLSGGWASAAFGVKGDLVFLKLNDKLHVECKNHEGWYVEDLITAVRTRGTTSLMAWWDQATSECGNKMPMLVFTRNNQVPFLMIRESDIEKFTAAGWWQFVPSFRFYMEGTKSGDGPIVILALRDFFKKCQPPKGAPSRLTWRSS